MSLTTNRDSILKSRGITLPTKVHLIKAVVFPVVMHGCESWTIKKADHQRIDAFELWCWRRCLRVPWTSRAEGLLFLHGLESNPESSLQLHRRLDSLEATQWAPRDTYRDPGGYQNPLLPLEPRPDSLGCHPVNNSRGKRRSIPAHKTRPDSPLPTMQGAVIALTK